MDALGINPVLLIAQLISFLTLFAVLNHFLYKKLRQSLQERRDMVTGAVKQKEEIEKKLAQIDQDRQAMKKTNQEELQELLTEAKVSAEKLREETLAQTEAKAKKLLDQAQEQIAQDAQEAQNDLRSQATLLAKEMVKKILTDQQKDKNFQKKVIDQSLKRL